MAAPTLCQSQDPFKPSNLQQSQYNMLRESTQKKITQER